MTSNPQGFDGCRRACRQAGVHTLAWGECEHAPEPEPTVSLSRVYADVDGRKSIGFDEYTVQQLAELIAAGLRASDLPVDADAFMDIASVAAYAIVHRNDEQPPAAAPAVFPGPPSRAAGQDEVDRLAEWLWDNCAEDERSGLLADDPRRIATVALHWPELRRVADEEQQQEPEASTAPLAAGLPLVKGNCPACCRASLFLGTGGYPTCSNSECPEPDAATTVLEQYANEAHPPTHAWKVESPRRDNWASWGTTYDERDWALERYESALEHASTRPFRLVRETTTYTVEAEYTPPALVEPAAADSEETRRCACPHPADEHSVYGCVDGCGCEWMPRRKSRPAPSS